MRTLLRVAATASFLAAGVVVGAMAISHPAYPQSVASKGDLKATPKDEARVPRCGMDFSTLVGLSGWRILEGKKLQAYLGTMFKIPPNGDALAYIRRGDKVALVLGRDGCVVARQVIPAKMHKKVVLQALGQAV